MKFININRNVLCQRCAQQHKLYVYVAIKRPYVSNTYNNWSPPAPSNESANGYFLERSNSARITLEHACELCPDEGPEIEETSEEGESSQADDSHTSSNVSKVVTMTNPNPSSSSNQGVIKSCYKNQKRSGDILFTPNTDVEARDIMFSGNSAADTLQVGGETTEVVPLTSQSVSNISITEENVSTTDPNSEVSEFEGCGWNHQHSQY